MFRKLLATTALAAFMTTGAFAASATITTEQPQDQTMQAAPADGYLASGLMGQAVYTTGEDGKPVSIGDVNDIRIGEAAGSDQVVIGVGGFLGIGEKSVAIPITKLTWTTDGNDRMLMVDATRAELEAAPEYRVSSTPTLEQRPAATHEAKSEAAPAKQAAQGVNASGKAAAEANKTTAMDGSPQNVDGSKTAAVNAKQWTEVEQGSMSADNLIGAEVYGVNDKEVGEIGDVIVTADGAVEAYIVDVGGFLGIGEKPVALDAGALKVMRDGSGDIAIRTNFTKEQLEAQAAYTKDAYATDRDSILLR